MKNWRKFILFAWSALLCTVLPAITMTPISEETGRTKKTGTVFSGTLELEPASEKELDNEKEAIINIKSNVSGAEVYLNGVYQGKTPCKISSVKPGKYKLELRKTNYESSAWTIYIRAGYELTYDVSLKEICGEIEFKNIPSGANVYIDGSPVYGSLKEIVIGKHNIRIRRFGFLDWKKEVEVRPYLRETVIPEWTEAPFELTDFRVSRSSLNPDYSSGLGKIKILFSVTNTEAASLLIFDENGRMTNDYKFPEFTTWDQTFVWNGKADDGSALPDGIYYIELKCAGTTYEETVTISRDMIYPMENATVAGLGYGRVPALEPLGVRFGNIGFFATPRFSGNKYDGIKCDISINGGFSNHWTAGGNFAMDFSGDDVSFAGTVSAMYMDTLDLGLGKLMSGIQLRYGFADSPLDNKGVDYGAGLGGVILAGYATRNFGVTFSGQVIAGCKSGNILEKETMFAGNIALTAKPFRVANFYAYGSYNNFNVLSAGVGLNTMPFGSIIMLSIGANADLFLANPDNIGIASGIRAGMSVIF